MDTTSVERKKEKKLDRSHWMCRIQKYSFGIDAPTFYMGYCPFFWMTWLSLLVSPIIFILKICNFCFGKPAAALWDRVCSYVEKLSTLRSERLASTPLRPSEKSLLVLLREYEYWEEGRSNREFADYISPFFDYSDGRYLGSTQIVRMMLWIEQNPDWKEHAENIRKKHNDALDKQFKCGEYAYAKQPVDSHRKLSNFVSLCGGVIFKVVIPIAITALILALAFLSWKVFAWIAVTFTFFQIMKIILIVLGTILGSLILTILVKLSFSKLERYIEVKDSRPKSLTAVFNFFSSTKTFVLDTVAITYKQECPMIIWGEETGKITRRDNSKRDTAELASS